MTYYHGVFASEQATSILPPRNVESALPVVFGCAPVHMSADGRGSVNQPVLAHKYSDAVAALGFHDDFENFDLAEAMQVFFALYNVAPVVFVNVLDPERHYAEIADESVTLDDSGEATLAGQHAIPYTVVIQPSGGGEALVEGDDYTLTLNGRGFAVIQRIPGGGIDEGETLQASYRTLDPSAVTASDVAGGIDAQTAAATGLELLNAVFPRFRLIPAQVLAPRFGGDSVVASILESKAANINAHFKGIGLVDIPTGEEGAEQYTQPAQWKNDNGLTSPELVACWPRVSLGDSRYRMSLHVAAVNMQRDDASGGVPYWSPSNSDMQADGLCLADGSVVELGPEQAGYLNGQGIVTGLNFIGGWKIWGNRTSCYPGNTDPKDSFIPVRRMFAWMGNTVVTTFWQRVDYPANRRLIETVLDSANIWVAGLVAQEYLLGGRVEFNSDENPVTDMIDGKYRFHVYAAPPVPAREIDFIIEYDAQYLQNLFG